MGPRNPGRALCLTSGRPCIMSMKAGAGSVTLPSNLLTTQPTAGLPPMLAMSLFLKPLWHWKASCAPAEPTSERMKTYRSAVAASRGINSETWKPGSTVEIGENSPRTSEGASGFRSIMSIWGGPPSRWTLMIALRDEPTPNSDSARSRSARVRLPTPRAPAVRNSRRVTPSQWRTGWPVILSIVRACKWGNRWVAIL